MNTSADVTGLLTLPCRLGKPLQSCSDRTFRDQPVVFSHGFRSLVHGQFDRGPEETAPTGSEPAGVPGGPEEARCVLLEGKWRKKKKHHKLGHFLLTLRYSKTDYINHFERSRQGNYIK